MIIAIDQGSSKTQVLIGDEHGTIYGVGKAGGACHYNVGVEASMHRVCEATDAALEIAGLSSDQVDRVSAGMCGANWQDEFDLLQGSLYTLFHKHNISVYNDCVAALYADANLSDAIVLCAGTEFNAAVRKEHKLIWTYNNYIEKNDKGGKSIGERALQCVFRSAMHMGAETTLTRRALDFFGYQNTMLMAVDFDRGVMPRLAKDFAVIVDEEAMRGDRMALEVQYDFGVSVSRYATASLQRFDMIGKPSEVVLTGGVFKARSPVMHDAICTEVHRVAPQARVVESKFEPVIGAYCLALDTQNEEDWRPNIEKSAKVFSLQRTDKE